MARHIVISGAGTGIGRAIALRLAQEPQSQLTLLARNVDRLEATAELVTEAGGTCAVAGCDIREQAAVDATFAAAAGAFGPISALVANSGIGGANAPGPEDRWADLVATNLTGTYYTARAAQAHMAAGPGARHIVIISSVLARIGVPGYTGYCASKAGLLGLARALAAELAGDEIQVNAICPGWVDTAMAREGLQGIAAAMGVSVEEAYTDAMSQVPLGRMSAPEDIAGMVAWLCSADARGVTGQGLDMNGGAFMS
jgi:NAD(P)-dependent dehydrogenase (short-subunit alcohol dehydrogenase family)